MLPALESTKSQASSNKNDGGGGGGAGASSPTRMGSARGACARATRPFLSPHFMPGGALLDSHERV